MKTKNNAIALLIKETFLQGITSLSNNYQGSSLTDIFITVDKQNGLVSFFDDEENCVASIVVEDWLHADEEVEEATVISLLQKVTEQIADEDLFSSLDLFKPFSINYANEEFDVIQELLLIDEDNTLKLNDSLMEKFDREFAVFLENLMKE